MTQQWFLLILVCYVDYTAKYLTYLLKSTEVIQIWEFDNLHMTQCAKIIVGFMANVGNGFLCNVYKGFLFSPRFFTFFIFISTFITSMVQTTNKTTEIRVNNSRMTTPSSMTTPMDTSPTLRGTQPCFNYPRQAHSCTICKQWQQYHGATQRSTDHQKQYG